jgi:RNA polymerase sigma-70 factor, ECF subfamily
MSEAAANARGNEEAGLVERARRGDAAALDALVAEHYRPVYEVAYRILGDPDQAADATQDTFVNAIKALASFRGESRLRTWLLRIAVNTARSAGRRTTSRREVVLDVDAQGHRSKSDPAEAAVTRSEADRAETALHALPEKQRLAVTLRIYQGLSHREIADALESTEGAVRVNYHLGIKRLRELLA